MVKFSEGLLSFMNQKMSKRPAYILVVCIIALAITSTVILGQYHYYAIHHQLANEISESLVAEIKVNLK